MPYRNADLTVDTGRIDKAVNYLLSPGGYRGAVATEKSIPEAASVDVAKKLAKAFVEIGRWNDIKYKPAQRVREYLQQKGITEDFDVRGVRVPRVRAGLRMFEPQPEVKVQTKLDS